MSSHGKVIYSGDNYVIRESDLQRLLKNDWLNDVLIGFYLERLETKYDNKSIKIFGPEVTQMIKLLPSSEILDALGTTVGTIRTWNYIVLPVNDENDPSQQVGGSHWSLIVYSKEDNMFFHFDSCGSSNAAPASTLFGKLKSFVGTGLQRQLQFVGDFSFLSGINNPDTFIWSIDVKFLSAWWCGHQNNGQDCGLHVLSNIEKIVEAVANGKKKSLFNIETANPEDAICLRKKLIQILKRE